MYTTAALRAAGRGAMRRTPPLRGLRGVMWRKHWVPKMVRFSRVKWFAKSALAMLILGNVVVAARMSYRWHKYLLRADYQRDRAVSHVYAGMMGMARGMGTISQREVSGFELGTAVGVAYGILAGRLAWYTMLRKGIWQPLSDWLKLRMHFKFPCILLLSMAGSAIGSYWKQWEVEFTKTPRDPIMTRHRGLNFGRKWELGPDPEEEEERRDMEAQLKILEQMGQRNRPAMVMD